MNFLRPKSALIYQELCQQLPGGVNSPVRAFSGLDCTPLIVESGQGDSFVDADGFSHIDYCGSWGALIHGHAHALIVQAVQKRVASGTTFGLSTPVESRLAARICMHLPSIEKIRFVSSGTEATMSAVRLARAFTKRALLVKFDGHYHGHSDSLLVQAGSGVLHFDNPSFSQGVPQDFVKHTLSIPFNDKEAVRTLFRERGHEIAALIVEPIAANMGLVLPERGFLELLREETRKAGALLIFDEVITGFRVGLQGAQGLFKITPDMTCLGKIIGGGFPAAAFGGRAEIMELLAPVGAVYQAGTLSGNPVAMEAGLQALLLCERPHFYASLEEKALFLLKPVEEKIKERGLDFCLNRVGSMFTLFSGRREVKRLADVKACDSSRFKQLWHFLLGEGIYFSPSQFEVNFISSAHTWDHLLVTRNALLAHLDE